jgi:hypothetical protein
MKPLEPVETPQSLCGFAIRRAEITPPVGIYHRMWGAASHDRAEGVHRPLLATALVFQQWHAAPCCAPTQILLALDHCLMGAAEIESLLASIHAASGMAREDVTVVFSHTHAAGLLSPDRVALPGGDLIPGYLRRVGDTAASLVAQAMDAVQPATITYGVGRCSLAANRDLWDATSNQWVCGFNPAVGADDTVVVARVTGPDDRLLATIVNYACHPTTLAWQNRLISPDFPGAMRALIEESTGVPSVFLQGASGDLGPREGFVGDVEVADRNGRQLGHAGLATLASLPPPKTHYCYAGPVVSGATLGTWAHRPLPEERTTDCSAWCIERGTVDLDYRADLPRRDEVEREREELTAKEQQARAAGEDAKAADLRALVERRTRLLARLSALPAGPAYPFEVGVWRIGDAIWVAVQGEPYNQLQRRLRDRFAPTPIVVCALANGWGPSYLPPRESYGKGLYQESVAVLAAGCLERLTDQLTERIERCLADQP